MTIKNARSPDNFAIPKLIRSEREAAGLSRTELAERAGISVSTMYMFEQGLLDVRTSTLRKILSALGLVVWFAARGRGLS